MCLPLSLCPNFNAAYSYIAGMHLAVMEMEEVLHVHLNDISIQAL